MADSFAPAGSGGSETTQECAQVICASTTRSVLAALGSHTLPGSPLLGFSSNMKRTFPWVTAALVANLLMGSTAIAQASPYSTEGLAPSRSNWTAPSASTLAQQILSTGDHKGQPFAIVDKVASLIWVYRGDGTLVGSSSVLLGQTPGDTTVPGVGERTQARRLRPNDRTTPAGRFASEPGHNQSGEAVVWIDYEAAFAIHRLRPSPPGEKRAQRLASANPRDKRISAGCVVVPVAFYLQVVEPVLGRCPGVVYVMPEVPSLTA